MSVNSQIAKDLPAARRVRWLAPLLVLLALAALTVAPGIIAELGDRSTFGATTPRALTTLAALPLAGAVAVPSDADATGTVEQR